MTPEELVDRSRDGSDEQRAAAVEELFRRFYPQVSRWCRRVCGDAEKARDVTQEVFLRVHSHLDSFRGQSRFSTWLYTVTRRVAINRMQFEQLRRAQPLEHLAESYPGLVDDSRSPEELAESRELVVALRRSIADDLTREEAQILYLHFADGLTLPAISEMLALENKSGAKAYIVSAKRKLARTYGRWLSEQGSGANP